MLKCELQIAAAKLCTSYEASGQRFRSMAMFVQTLVMQNAGIMRLNGR